MTMKSSDVLVKCLQAEGVERIFGIPGEENLDLMDSLIGLGVEFVLTRHESSAAFMAGMVGRLTGRPGVCLTTLGPGAANMAIGVMEAYLGYYPLVAMSGQLPANCQRYPRKQYVDLRSMFKPITKECISVRSGDDVPHLTRRAFALAAEERPGPVFFELPQDVMGQSAEGAPREIVPRDAVEVPPEALAMVRELLSSAQRPVVLSGAGVVRGGAGEALRRFAEVWNLPVAMTWLGAGTMPFDHPLSLGTVGLRRADMMRAAFEAADLVVLVGFDLMEFEPQYWNFGTAKRVAYIAAAPCDIVPGFAPDVQVIGDLSTSLRSLANAGRPGAAWTKELKESLVSMLNTVPEENHGVKPQTIVRCVRDALGREDIVVSDVGAHLIWMAQRYPVYRENTLLMSNGLFPMGVGVPWAIAAKLTFPACNVVASVGDGSFAMTGMELETAKRLHTPFITLVWNDRSLELIRIKQEKTFGRAVGTSFDNPDLVKYAESLGIEGRRVSSEAELRETLTEFLRDDVLAVIDVAVDSGENAGLSPK